MILYQLSRHGHIFWNWYHTHIVAFYFGYSQPMPTFVLFSFVSVVSFLFVSSAYVYYTV